MFDASNVFVKVFAREFYRLNAGFFIIIITLTFGFMSGAEHKALAEFFVASPLLTCIPITLWMIYSIKVVAFNRQRLRFTENYFLFNASKLSYAHQFYASVQNLAIQFLPVLLYGTFLIFIALMHEAFLAVILIVVAISLLIVFSSASLVWSLQTPLRELKISAVKKFIDEHTVRPVWWIYINTALRQEPFLFLATKVFAGALLFGVLQLYVDQDYDGRLLAMGATIVGVGNFMMMMQLQSFDFKYFILIKNLPIKLFQRWWCIAFVTLILVLPEIILMLKYAPGLPAVELFSILMLIPSLALTVYSLLFLRFTKEDTYARVTFALAITHLLFILFKVPVYVFVLLNFSASWLIFRKKYYTFEMMPAAKE